MGLDRLADDELHAREADAVVRQERGLEGQIRVAQVDHDLGGRPGHLAHVGAIDVEGDLARVDPRGIPLGAGNGDRLAGGNGRRAVARSNDRRDAQLTGDDRSVAGAPAAIGDDRGGGLHHGLPVRRRHVRHQHLARLEARQLLDVPDRARRSGGDHLADGSALRDDLALTVQDVGLEHRLPALGGHRLGAGLHQIELAVEAVLGPLHVHRLAVVALDLDRVVGELQDVLVVEAVLLAVRLGGRDVANRVLALALDEDHLDRLVADQAAQHGAVTLLEGGLVDIELVRIDGALDHVLAEAVGAGDEDDVAEARLGVEREEDAGGREVGPDHLHDPDRQRDLEVVEALIDPVVDGAVREQAGEAAAAGVEEALVAVDVEIGLLLAGEARGGQVLGGGRASHREARVLPVLLPELPVALEDLAGQVVRQPGAVDDLPGALAAPRQIGHVVGVQIVEGLVKPAPGIRLLQDVTVGIGGGGVSVGHEHALVGQLAVHLAERRVLAAHQRNVVDADLFEETDVLALAHGLLPSTSQQVGRC